MMYPCTCVPASTSQRDSNLNSPESLPVITFQRTTVGLKITILCNFWYVLKGILCGYFKLFVHLFYLPVLINLGYSWREMQSLHQEEGQGHQKCPCPYPHTRTSGKRLFRWRRKSHN